MEKISILLTVVLICISLIITPTTGEGTFSEHYTITFTAHTDNTSEIVFAQINVQGNSSDFDETYLCGPYLIYGEQDNEHEIPFYPPEEDVYTITVEIFDSKWSLKSTDTTYRHFTETISRPYSKISFHNASFELRDANHDSFLDGIESWWEVISDSEREELVDVMFLLFDHKDELLEYGRVYQHLVNETNPSWGDHGISRLSPGDYTLKMLLVNETHQIKDEHTNAFTLGRTANFTGEIHHQEIYENNDPSLDIESIRFFAAVDCINEGDYSIYSHIVSEGVLIKTVYEEIYLEQGSNNISFDLEGVIPYREKISSYITIEHIGLYDGSRLIDKMDSPYETQEYHYTDFARPDVYFTGNFRSDPTDPDERGYYEYLTFEMEMTSRITSSSMRITTGVYGEDEVRIATLSEYQPINQGTNWLPLRLDGTLISDLEYQGGFVIVGMSVEDGTGVYDRWKEPYTTRSYHYSDFAIPETRLMSITDQGLDTDGSGYFNHLRITAEVNMNEGGPYTIESTLRSRFGRTIDTVRLEKDLDERIQTVNVDFDGHKIYRFGGTDTSYRVDLEITPSDEQIPVIREENIRTDNYDHTQFERPVVQISGVVSDVAKDTDGDGYYNELAFTLELEVRESGSYVIHSTLLDSQGYREVTSNTKETTLASGTQQTVITFPGQDIFRSRLDGYVLGYMTVFKDGELVNEINLAHTTSVGYSWKEFQPLPAYVADCTAYMAPPTTEGEYGVLRVEVTVNVTEDRSETYQIQALVYTVDGYYIREESVSQALQKGSNNISVDIPGNIFNMKQRDGPYVVRRVRVIQGENIIDELNDVYTTEAYSYRDFMDIELKPEDEPEKSSSYGHLLPYILSIISISVAAVILVYYWKNVG